MTEHSQIAIKKMDSTSKEPVRQIIKIHVLPQNPVQYLACCGIVEIVARFDPISTSKWVNEPAPALEIETIISEKAIVDSIVGALTDWTHWKVEPKEGNEVNRIVVNFVMKDETKRIHLDWWYETLDTQGSINEKSAWKMYAGQQTVEGIFASMVECAQMLAGGSPTEISALIGLNTGMRGRFGYDPRSSRNALDAGFSANDLKLKVSTYPFAEMLATIGAQTFFPSRTKQSGGIESTRGWKKTGQNKDIFLYRLWMVPLPVTLARVAASCSVYDESRYLVLMAPRVPRGEHSNLLMAEQAKTGGK